MEKPIKDNDSFTQGYICTVATFISQHDQPTMAADILMDGGITFKECIRIGCSNYDMKKVRPILKELESG